MALSNLKSYTEIDSLSAIVDILSMKQNTIAAAVGCVVSAVSCAPHETGWNVDH